MEGAGPSVAVILPVLNEAAMLAGCLEAVAAQDYPVTQVIVADGGSTDSSRELAARFAAVELVDNPRRSRPAGLNVAIAHVTADVIVRVDARTRIAPDYVRRCVEALETSGAAIVGGPMDYRCETARQRGIAAALRSRLGAGPAEFRRLGGAPRFVDTVYLGAYRRKVIADLGGYDEWSGGNEDAELAIRAQSHGGVYLDPRIASTYVAREGLGPLARQFFRYGRNRARTVRKHPSSVSARQLAVPALVLGILSPWRRFVLGGYIALLLSRAAAEAVQDPAAAPTFLASLPTMHFSWGAGFLRGLLGPTRHHGDEGCEQRVRSE